MVSYQVCVVGEAGSGKTSLLNALDGKEVAGKNDKSGFWRGQFSGSKLSKTDPTSGATFQFNEVMGSRGRSSNYRALLEGVKNADVVLICLRAKDVSEWHFNSIDHLVDVIGRAGNKTAKVVLVGTQVDLKSPEFDRLREGNELAAKLVFHATSATRGDGIDELLSVLHTEAQHGAPAYAHTKAWRDEQEEEAKKRKAEDTEEAKKKKKADQKAEEKARLLETLNDEVQVQAGIAPVA